MRNSTKYQYFHLLNACWNKRQRTVSRKNRQMPINSRVSQKKLGSPRLVRHSQNENQNENLNESGRARGWGRRGGGERGEGGGARPLAPSPGTLKRESAEGGADG